MDTTAFSSRNRLSSFFLGYCSTSTNSYFLSGFGRITWSFSWLCFPFYSWLKFLEAVHCCFCLELFCVTVIISNTDNCIITTFFWSIHFSLWVLPWFLYHFFLSQLFLTFLLEFLWHICLCLSVEYENYHTPLDCRRANFLPQLLICRKNSHLVLQLLFYFT